jgi:hypothetical protein
MTLKTVNWPNERAWDLVDDKDNGNVVMMGGPYSATSTFHYEQEDIGKSQYLNVHDKFDDGICCDRGQELFSAKMDDGVVVASGGAFRSAC